MLSPFVKEVILYGPVRTGLDATSLRSAVSMITNAGSVKLDNKEPLGSVVLMIKF